MILFIAKRRYDYSNQEKQQSTGLYNSIKFIEDILHTNNIDVNFEVAADNNSIDALLHKYKPLICVIEALWVVPTKITELTKLHPKVKFIIRLHSDTPFLATEGIAMNWVSDYLKIHNTIIAPNSPRLTKELKAVFNEYTDNIVYLPNYYPIDIKPKPYVDSDTINISCFGAIRPLKNHLIQAHAAIAFAKKLNKKLYFLYLYNKK